jgi:SAM-dependent methyltransferase
MKGIKAAMEHSLDYHDYVFKDGRFIGRFDEMYQHSSEVPWAQDKLVNSVMADIDIAILKQVKCESICEVGCGLGYFANRTHKELRSQGGGAIHFTGIDISKTAIEKAKRMFPEILFIEADLMLERPLQGKHFDIVIIKEVVWYVCHGLNNFLQNVLDLVKNDGYLYVGQSFPEVEQWVGKDIIDSPETLLKMFKEYVNPIHSVLEMDWVKGRPYLHLLGKIRKRI